MAKQKMSGLGRGLDAIFLDNMSEQPSGRSITMLRISDVEPNAAQPRKTFDAAALASLAQSILEHGVIQPIVVRASAGGFYSIIAGERRWRAAKLAKLTEIPAICIDADELKAAKLALIENLQRENLSPIEESNAYHMLMEQYGMTQETLASSVGKSRSAVANSLRLLDLPPEIASMVGSGGITAGHARTLLGLKNKADILPLARRITQFDMSVRQTEEAVKAANRAFEEARGDDGVRRHAPPKVDYAHNLAASLTEKIGRSVKVSDGGRVKKLVIEYADNDDLEALCKLLTGSGTVD
ncbi:MAG: ParB/RepB/Spo0J family partition protein [Eubacteriales bacterium]